VFISILWHTDIQPSRSRGLSAPHPPAGSSFASSNRPQYERIKAMSLKSCDPMAPDLSYCFSFAPCGSSDQAHALSEGSPLPVALLFLIDSTLEPLLPLADNSPFATRMYFSGPRFSVLRTVERFEAIRLDPPPGSAPLFTLIEVLWRAILQKPSHFPNSLEMPSFYWRRSSVP